MAIDPTETIRVIFHRVLSSAITPAVTAASAMGKMGKRNLVMLEVQPIPIAVTIQTVRDVRQAGVLRTTRIKSGTKASTSGPKNCQKPTLAGSIHAKTGNFKSCQKLRDTPTPVSARYVVSA